MLSSLAHYNKSPGSAWGLLFGFRFFRQAIERGWLQQITAIF
jgi:hypothetical protein